MEGCLEFRFVGISRAFAFRSIEVHSSNALKRASAILLCILFCMELANAQPASECQPTINPDFLAKHDDLATGKLPAADYLDRVLECNVPRVGQLDRLPSNWIDAERAAYSSVLEKTKPQVLVVPFQVQGYALDRIERALMSIDLTYELSALLDVSDPTIVARALGEGSRRIDPTTILELAHRVHVRKVIVPFVGHDNSHAMTITIQVLDVEASNTRMRVLETKQKDWRAVPFTDDVPPFIKFHQMLPQILADLSLSSPRRRHLARTSEQITGSSFSVSPTELVSGHRLPASAALSVLGALESPTAELARERLFQRALIDSMNFDSPGANTAFLQAYALMSLQHRPAALALLRDASAPDAVVLRALLNGDLPGARGAVSRVTDPLKSLLLQISIEDTRQEYGDPSPADLSGTLALFGTHADDWLPLVKGRFGDSNSWTVDSAEEIKLLLDRAFPRLELALESIEAGDELLRSIPNNSLDVVMDIASARHVRKVAAQLEPAKCCAGGSAFATPWDLLWLIEGRADARLIRRLQMISGHQGNLRRALSVLDEYEPFFSGHPGMAAERGLAASGLLASEPDDLRADRRAVIKQSGLLAAQTGSGENQVGFRGVGALGNVSPDIAGLFWHVYAYDFPRRPFWPLLTVLKDRYFDQPTYERSARESLLYSTTDLDPIANIPSATDEQKRSLANDLQTRFIGAPGRSGILALLHPSTAPPLDPIEELRKEIQEEPDTWLNYYNLGVMLVRRDDDYPAAATLFLSYPQFHSHDPPNRVALSHEAYDAAAYLYLHGHTELSEPLYRIAANLHTGSEPEMSATSRLLLLSRNFSGAMAATFDRATQYPSAYAYRDYLSFLHATGHGKEAWQVFPSLSVEFDLPLVWISALVGHRMEGRSDGYVREWLQRPEIRAARFHAQQFGPAFAIMWSATDRKPPSDLADFVASLIDGPGPHQSDLTYFAAGYTELRYEHWQKASAAFAMSKHYPDALPYRTMAAVKTGDRNWLDKTYGNSEFRIQYPAQFYESLGHAIYAGDRHENDAALEFLRRAFNDRPNTDNSVISTEYEYSEVCEWLYEETHDQRFVDRLLQWVKSYQNVQPTQAWAYAMEYTYREPGAPRKRALALTLYLDPLSPRIKHATPAEIKEAREWLKSNNPFMNHAVQSIDGAPTTTASNSASPRNW